MIRAFSDLNDILIDPSTVESIHEDSGSGSSEEYAEEFDKPDYDEDFEEESPAKNRTVENFSVNSSPNDATYISSKVCFSPSPPKKLESPSDSHQIASPTETSPRAARIQSKVEKSQETPTSGDVHVFLPTDDGDSFLRSPTISSKEKVDKSSIEFETSEEINKLIPSPFIPIAKPINTLYSTKSKAPRYFSRVTKVENLNPSPSSKEDNLIQQSAHTDADIEEIVRKVIHSDDIKKSLADAVLLHINAPTPVKKDLHSLRIPNYDRYYDICMEIQELVRRERERELLHPLEAVPVQRWKAPPSVEDSSSSQSSGPEVQDKELLLRPYPSFHRSRPPFLAGKAPKPATRAYTVKENPQIHTPHRLRDRQRDRTPTAHRSHSTARSRPQPSTHIKPHIGLNSSEKEPILHSYLSHSDSLLSDSLGKSPQEVEPVAGEPVLRSPSCSSGAALTSLRRQSGDIADRCDLIYSTFLRDLTGRPRCFCQPSLKLTHLLL